MRQNVSDYEMELENVISEAFTLLEDGDFDKAKEILKIKHEEINESYE